MTIDFEPRRIRYIPGPVAYQAHAADKRVKLVWGPLGTAKTTWLCWRIYLKAEVAARHGYSLRALLLRDTYRNLIDSTLQTFLYWFPEGVTCYYAHSDPIEIKLRTIDRITKVESYHDVLFRHGQTEQDASMFLSTEYDLIGLEEVAPAYLPGAKRVSPGIAEEVFDMAYSRLTREAARAETINPELIMSCNPPPLTHWTSKRVIDKPPDYLERVGWGHWYFDIAENAANLRPDYYDNLEQAWEGKRGLIQRFIKGERLPVFVGSPRFNLDQLDRMRLVCVDPTFRGFLRPTVDNLLHVKLEPNPEGFVRMWQPPVLAKRYVISADAAEGIEGGDYSSAHVLDRETLDIVATWHGHCEPEQFATELALLGYLYNRALIAVESYPSAHGLTTLTTLKHLGYPHIFYSRNVEVRGRAMERIGWRSTRTTKSMLVDGIGNHISVEKGEPDPYIPDVDLIGELQTFGVMEDGSTAAQDGCFDDRVISYGLGLLVAKVGSLSQIYPGLNREQEQKAAQ